MQGTTMIDTGQWVVPDKGCKFATWYLSMNTLIKGRYRKIQSSCLNCIAFPGCVEINGRNEMKLKAQYKKEMIYDLYLFGVDIRTIARYSKLTANYIQNIIDREEVI